MNSNIFEASLAQNMNISGEHTYIDDEGYKRCSVCGERKEEDYPEDVVNGTNGKLKKHPRNCKCDRELLEKKEAEERKYQEQMKIERRKEIRRSCVVNEKYRSCTFDLDNGSNPQIIKIAKRYVEKVDHFISQKRGLIFWGDIGAGKSFATACIINALIDQDVPCTFTSLSYLIDKNFKYDRSLSETIDELMRFKVIAFDDFGVERGTEYMSEQVYRVIDSLCEVRSLIFTTNLSLAELKSPRNMTESRIFVRILGCCTPIEVKGASQRRRKTSDAYITDRSILGLEG